MVSRPLPFRHRSRSMPYRHRATQKTFRGPLRGLPCRYTYGPSPTYCYRFHLPPQLRFARPWSLCRVRVTTFRAAPGFVTIAPSASIALRTATPTDDKPSTAPKISPALSRIFRRQFDDLSALSSRQDRRGRSTQPRPQFRDATRRHPVLSLTLR